MSRRDKGTGSVKFRKDTNKWQARVVTGYKTVVKKLPDGNEYERRDPITINASFATKRQADEWIVDTLARKKAGDLSADKLTIDQYFTGGKSKAELLSGQGGGWLEQKRSEVSRRTFEDYVRNYFYYIEPWIAGEQINTRTLTTKAVKDWQLQVARKHSNYLANLAKNQLSNALGDAVAEGSLPYNVAAPVRNLRHEKPEKEIWTPDEIEVVVQESAGTRFHALFYVGLMTGLRPAELMALLWDRISVFDKPRNSDVGQIKIDLAIKTTLGKPELGKPKNAYSIRELGISQATLNRLEEHQEIIGRKVKRKVDPMPNSRQGSYYVQDTRPFEDHGLVFPTLTGTLFRMDNIQQDFARFCQVTGVTNIGMYGLRHTFASMMIANGVDVVRLSKLMGHERPDTTLRNYAHMFQRKTREPLPDLLDLIKGL